MLLKHRFIKKIAHSSYILAGNETCAIIDPSRDVDYYIEEARERDLKITHILETHLHADFISGHMDLAERTGAKIYAPKSANCTFDHVPLSEGDTFEIEDMKLEVLETPGHTPEHITYVVTDRSRGDGPVGVFCGDTLFVGDVGRPDLFPDMAEKLADELYHSLHDKLLRLPDYCEVYPAHGAGSLCGRSMGAKWRSTIGFERKYNEALQIKDKQEFIKSLTSNMPAAPDHFSRCSDINRQGPTLISELPKLLEMKPLDFHNTMQKNDKIVLDVRSYDAFSSQHVPGSWHIDFGGNFPTFAGWVLPFDKDIMLVAHDYEQAKEANIWLRRVGLDSGFASLDGGMFEWAVSGLHTKHVNLLAAKDLQDMIKGSNNFVLLDVRAPEEYKDNHIQNAINIPVPNLRTRYKELDTNKKIVLTCSTGHRSSLGSSILSQYGFKDINNLAGGMKGYSAAGFTKRCTICANPHGSRYFSDK